MSYTISITQDIDSAMLQITARLYKKSRDLQPGVPVEFLCESGKRFLMLDIITPSSQDHEFQLNLTNAQRFNGNSYIRDTGYHEYATSLAIYIPEA